jgi:hypothetical protein
VGPIRKGHIAAKGSLKEVMMHHVESHCAEKFGPVGVSYLLQRLNQICSSPFPW